jgi:hypothetical protein
VWSYYLRLAGAFFFLAGAFFFAFDAVFAGAFLAAFFFATGMDASFGSFRAFFPSQASSTTTTPQPPLINDILRVTL